MRSLNNRLYENRKEILDCVAKYGYWRAMEKYGVHDYSCFRRWLEQETGDANFGMHPRFAPDNMPLGDQLVEAFLSKVAILETEGRRQKERIRHLEWQLEQHTAITTCKTERQAEAILNACEN